MILLSFGDQIDTANYKMHSRFRRVVNFIDAHFENRIISIVNDDIGRGPLNIVVRNVDFENLENLTYLKITKTEVFIDEKEFRRDKSLLYNSSIELTNINLAALVSNVKYAKKVLLEISHPLSLSFLLADNQISSNRYKNFKTSFEKNFAAKMLDAKKDIVDKNFLSGIKKFKGCGLGLTPSGDDFICGLFIAFHFMWIVKNRTEAKISTPTSAPPDFYSRKNSLFINELYKKALGGNIFSNNFLWLAKNGHVIEKVKLFLAALTTRSKSEITKNLKSMLEVGASSGADFASGLLIGIGRLIG